MFDVEKVTKENTVVHCPTKEEALLLLAWADTQGYLWNNGERYIDDSEWEDHREHTCYYLNSGTYSNIERFARRGFEVLKFNEAKLFEDKRSVGEVTELEALIKRARFPLIKSNKKTDLEVKVEITNEVRNLLDELVVEEQNLLGQPMGSIVNKNEVAEKITLLFFGEGC